MLKLIGSYLKLLGPLENIMMLIRITTGLEDLLPSKILPLQYCFLPSYRPRLNLSNTLLSFLIR
eukprot:UN06675